MLIAAATEIIDEEAKKGEKHKKKDRPRATNQDAKKERESKGARVYKIYFDMAQAASAVSLFSGAMLLAIVGGYYG